MGRWLPAILLFGLTTLCSCAEEPDNAYPGNTQNKALKAWMTQNRPDLLENYQEEGEYYVDVISLGDLADSAILETESWVWYDITGRDLQGNISVARDSVYALQQGTFTPYTHYVPYYQFYGELASGTFKEGTYLAMRNPLKLGETYAAQKGFPREVELRVGAEVVLYMPATIISTEANGDGGYEGQYALSANHPMIARIKLVGRSSQPIETESVAVDDFAAANGGLDPTGSSAGRRFRNGFGQSRRAGPVVSLENRHVGGASNLCEREFQSCGRCDRTFHLFECLCGIAAEGGRDRS